MLGGSTGLNLLAWDRASKAEYDSWNLFFPDESSSSPSSNHIKWDFDSLLPYFRKSENVDLAFYDTLPGLSEDDYHKAKAEMERDDGSSGPIQVISDYASSLTSVVLNPSLGLVQLSLYGPCRSVRSSLEQSERLYEPLHRKS
jgi:choline dehydrogenase-like flavoprotein